MTTKDHRLFFIDKQNIFVPDISNGKFNNLNLNQNNQCPAKTVQTFKNVDNHNKKTSNYDYSDNNDPKTRQNFTSFGKPKLTSSFANLNIQKDNGKKEESKEGKTLNANSSTLSLHITAYENSIIATSDNPIDGAKDEMNKKKENISSIKKWKAVKESFNGSSSIFNYAFELPRQQRRNQNNDPEVMQFKASQRLSNVNQPSPAVFGSYSAATNLIPQRPPPASVNSAPSSSNCQARPVEQDKSLHEGGDDEEYDSECSESSSGSSEDDKCQESEQEPESDYENGGYHPVNLGDVFDSRYYTMRKLGWGHFATVWLAFDSKENIFTAIKIPKSREDYIEAAKDEYEILREMRKESSAHLGSKNVVQMLNVFDFYGVDECLHFCMVFEVLGDNLLTLLRKFNTLNLNFVKVVAKQMLQGLSFIHDKCNIIHTDIKPENVVISLTQKQIYQLAIDAFNFHGSDKQAPKSMASTCSEEYRNEYYLKLSGNARKRIRRCRKKHRDKVEQFLKIIDSDADLPRLRDDIEEPHIGGGDQAAGSSSGDDVIDDDEDDNSFENNPISRYYEQLQAGNIACLKQCQIKIVDFGNACYVEEHFSEEIQTREYRSPEVIIGCGYDTSADIWSTACVIFELAAGDYLFYPENHENGIYDCDDDHVAKIQEIMGPLPSSRFRDGRRYNHLFDSRGNLHRIPKLAPAPLKKIITDLADLTEEDAEEMSNFLKPMLNLDTRYRAKAEESLRSQWLILNEMCQMKRKRRDTLELV